MKNRVFLDVDGVIARWTCQFIEYLEAETELSIDYLPSISDQTNYYFIEKYLKNKYDINFNDYADRFHGDEEFWSSMKIYDWSEKLLDIVAKATNGNFRFLTKAANTPASFSGKYKFINKHFPKYLNRLVITNTKKSFLAHGNAILIDDSSKNISEWVKAGGQVFYWRELDYNSDPIEVKTALDELKDFLNKNV